MAEKTNRNTKQNSVHPGNSAHTRRHGNTPEAQTVESVLYFDHRRATYTRATLGRTITLCHRSVIGYNTDIHSRNSLQTVLQPIHNSDVNGTAIPEQNNDVLDVARYFMVVAIAVGA